MRSVRAALVPICGHDSKTKFGISKAQCQFTASLMHYVNRHPVQHSLCLPALGARLGWSWSLQKRHTVPNARGDTVKIFIMIDPTLMSFLLSAGWAFPVPSGESLGHRETWLPLYHCYTDRGKERRRIIKREEKKKTKPKMVHSHFSPE